MKKVKAIVRIGARLDVIRGLRLLKNLDVFVDPSRLYVRPHNVLLL